MAASLRPVSVTEEVRVVGTLAGIRRAAAEVAASRLAAAASAASAAAGFRRSHHHFGHCSVALQLNIGH